MFINFWYAAATSEELTDAPRHVKMLGQDFVLFRDTNGVAQCLSNVCSHRGGSLADGKIKGDCIECPYHGWQFDGEGACRRLPSMGKDANIPARARVDAYPVQEKYGLVFAFLGDLPEAERPPLMEVPEFGDPNWRENIQIMEWAIDYKRSIENTIDPAHNEFVHPTHGFSGENPDYFIPDYDIIEAEWGCGHMDKRLAPPLKDEKMRAASKRQENAYVEAGSGYHGPAQTWTYIHPTENSWMHQYMFETPTDEGHVRIYLINMRKFLLEPEHDARFKERNLVVAGQDQDILERLQPVLTPSVNIHETFVNADKLVARYRDDVKKWQANGWRIDISALRKGDQRVAFAVPSPARRESKNWALDPVPLLPAGRAAEDLQAAE